MEKRFYRSRTDKKLAGVCAGIAEYFEIDPTLVRLLWVVFTFAGGAGIIAYIIAAIIMPEAPEEPGKTGKTHHANFEDADIIDVEEDINNQEQEKTEFAEKKQNWNKRQRESGGEITENRNQLVIGLVLIFTVIMFFSRNFFRWFWIDFSYLWPLILIVIGIVMILNKRK